LTVTFVRRSSLIILGEMILSFVGGKLLSTQVLTGQEVGRELVPDRAGNILQVAVIRMLKNV